MVAWKRSTRIDRSCCGGIITRRFVSLLIKKYQQDKKEDTRWQIASRFQFLISFSETLKSTITTSFTSRQLATSYEILVARTKFLVALATRKAQSQTLQLPYTFPKNNPHVISGGEGWP